MKSSNLENSVTGGSLPETGDSLVELSLAVNGLGCGANGGRARVILERTGGVSRVRVNALTGQITFCFDANRIRLREIKSNLSRGGFAPLDVVAGAFPEPAAQGPRDFGAAGKRRLVIAIPFTLAVLGIEVLPALGSWVALWFGQWIDAGLAPLHGGLVQWLLILPVVFASRAELAAGLRGIAALRPNGASLTLLAAGGAFLWGTSQIILSLLNPPAADGNPFLFGAAAVILCMSLAAAQLESVARSAAGGLLKRLRASIPSTVTVAGESGALDLRNEEIRVGDRILVNPGDTIPVDGEVLEGATDVDESIIAGGGRAVRKSVGEAVFAGTVNLSAGLAVRVQAAGGETRVLRLAAMLDDALCRAPVSSRNTERWVTLLAVATIFVALISAVAACLMGATLPEGVARLVSVAAIVSCAAVSWALVLGKGLAISSLASQGAILPHPDSFEALAGLDIVAISGRLLTSPQGGTAADGEREAALAVVEPTPDDRAGRSATKGMTEISARLGALGVDAVILKDGAGASAPIAQGADSKSGTGAGAPLAAYGLEELRSFHRNGKKIGFAYGDSGGDETPAWADARIYCGFGEHRPGGETPTALMVGGVARLPGSIRRCRRVLAARRISLSFAMSAAIIGIALAAGLSQALGGPAVNPMVATVVAVACQALVMAGAFRAASTPMADNSE